MANYKECPKCKGTKQFKKKRCPRCKGTGMVKTNGKGKLPLTDLERVAMFSTKIKY